MNIKMKSVFSLICGENGYLIYDEDSKDCLIIDPGFSFSNFVDEIQKLGLNAPLAILLTHGHADHIGGVPGLVKEFPDVKIVIGSKDAEKMSHAEKNYSAMFGFALTVPAPTQTLSAAREDLAFGPFQLTAYATPGHAAGHYVYVFEAPTPAWVFCGDLIFDGDVGRTDFYDGDWDALRTSIQDIIYTFPDDWILYSGHGDPTTVGRQARVNANVRR